MTVRSRNQALVSGRTGGPVVMLAHGFGCDENMWRLAVPLPETDSFCRPQSPAPEEPAVATTDSVTAAR